MEQSAWVSSKRELITATPITTPCHKHGSIAIYLVTFAASSLLNLQATLAQVTAFILPLHRSFPG